MSSGYERFSFADDPDNDGLDPQPRIDAALRNYDLEGHMDEDPISTENVLDPDQQEDVVPESENPHQSPILLDQIAGEVASGLERYGWLGAQDIDGEKFLELCELAGVAPETDRALTVFEDIFFSIEDQKYAARNLSNSPTIFDLEQTAVKIEDVVEFQKGSTLDSYMFLRRYLTDPILELQSLIAERQVAEETLESTMKLIPVTMEEYDGNEKEISEIQGHLGEIDERFEGLTRINEVKDRRERAFRRMQWVMRQDYMAAPINELLAKCKEEGIKPDFDLLAGYVAGRYEDVIEFEEPEEEQESKTNSETAAETKSKENENGEDPDKAATLEKKLKTKRVRKYRPGIIDQLLDEHSASMVDQSVKTDIDKSNDTVMLRRLEQAKALCQIVFQNDIADRIYVGLPITPSEYRMLQSVRSRLYVHGDIGVVDPFISFLPGSQLAMIEDKELNLIPLKRFSGRSTKDLMKEIDLIISEHPDLEIDRVAGLVEAKEKGASGRTESGFTESLEIELAVSALIVLEKLAFKENHSVRNLISND